MMVKMEPEIQVFVSRVSIFAIWRLKNLIIGAVMWSDPYMFGAWCEA
jgi:hypothetical protein